MLRNVLARFTRKKLCLIADDSALIRKAASAILKDLQFDTAEAENGLEAISQWRRTRPDAILLDHTMPYIDGLGVLDALNEHCGGKTPKIIFCTANRDPAHIACALNAGAHEYMIKPFDRDILAAKLDKLGLRA